MSISTAGAAIARNSSIDFLFDLRDKEYRASKDEIKQRVEWLKSLCDRLDVIPKHNILIIFPIYSIIIWTLISNGSELTAYAALTMMIIDCSRMIHLINFDLRLISEAIQDEAS